MLHKGSRSINHEITEADLVQAVLGQLPMTDLHFRAASQQTRKRLERVRMQMTSAKSPVARIMYAAHSV